jgi:hypothetical protein
MKRTATAPVATATARLSALGRVVACKVTRAGDWYVVDATLCRGGFVSSAYATAATLDAALAHLGC